jgi:hypothetical protein
MISAPHDCYGIDIFRILVNQSGFDRSLYILGISRTLLARYLSGASNVPRMACEALYWYSPYGRGLIDSDHIAAIGFVSFELNSVKRENARLREQIGHLLKIGNFGCANDAVIV